MPGLPAKANTSKPESSAIAGNPVNSVACRAFNKAFSTKVQAVSSMSGTDKSLCGMISKAVPTNSDFNSIILLELLLAKTIFMREFFYPNAIPVAKNKNGFTKRMLSNCKKINAASGERSIPLMGRINR